MHTALIESLKPLLIQQKLHVAAAESITCGMLQSALGSISGSSEYLEGGLTAYNLQQKFSLLHIDYQHAQSVNCVSQQVAEQMAEQVCLLFACDIGLATTGYAEPNKAHHIAIPEAYIAICHRHKLEISCVHNAYVTGKDLNRKQMQAYVTQRILQALLDYLTHRNHIITMHQY
ncbi:CinA family protein [Methylomonas sp. AM2-LC]|uniref:CinA family protein n=1 Tax=Methylomonas sp. AM2-LC TaxID=3153301 RepID=UPI0032637333